VDWTGPVPPNAVTRQEDVLGRGIVSTIYAGEPVVETRLAAKGAGAGLAAIIPSGMRAVAIRVNDVTSLAGYVTPGMRVDVLILGTPPNSSPALGTQTKTLLQNIEILSAGQQMQRDSEGKPITVPVVNVLVTPEQAEILSLASQDARIQLVLRNPLDTEQSKTSGMAMSRLWTGQSTPPAERAPRPRVVRAPVLPPPVPEPKVSVPVIVEIFHGGRGGSKKSEVKFKDNSEEN
jgi:pilus assembly protein CpaB